METRPANIFERHPGIFNPDPRDRSTDPARLVALAAQAHREAAARAREINAAVIEHAREAHRLESAGCDAERVEGAALESLVHAIVHAAPRPFPTIEEWHYCPSPLWKTAVGGKLFFVIPDRSTTRPAPEVFDDPSRLVDVVSWGIIDLDEVGGGR